MRSIILTAVALMLTCNFCLASDPLAQEYGDLVFVSVLYRHGDRAIAEASYPKDVYNNESYWPMGYGQLTNQGKNRHYEFGKWLRNRYNDFLPIEYSNKDIYIRSTSVDRALMSAAANLAGLYAPDQSQQWNDNVGKLWQPIPIHSMPHDSDMMLSFEDNCPRYKKELEAINNSPEIQQFNEKHKDLYNYLKENTGMNFTNPITEGLKLYDILLVETQFNYTLPEWSNTVFPEKLLKISELAFLLPTYNTIMKKLNAGGLLNEIVQHMKLKQNGDLKPDVKLWIYSGHDTNIVNLLNSLNVYDNILPPYSAAVFLELRKNKNSNTYVVTVSYRNTSTQDPYLLKIPGCNSLACDLDLFIDVVKPILITDWYEECHKDVENYLLTYISLIAVILIAVSIIIFMFYKKYFICYCGRNYEKLLYHAVPREETETVDFDQDGRSRVAVSFRMNGVESTSADV